MREIPTARRWLQVGQATAARLDPRALILATVLLSLTRTGAYWDVQWHYAVGRDTFSIPPHDLVYSGVALVGLLSLYMSWRRRVEDGRFVGASSIAWLLMLAGMGIMVCAAPFDDFWHRRYGLDVTISARHPGRVHRARRPLCRLGAAVVCPARAWLVGRTAVGDDLAGLDARFWPDPGRALERPAARHAGAL
jgi:hypothetical protein